MEISDLEYGDFIVLNQNYPLFRFIDDFGQLLDDDKGELFAKFLLKRFINSYNSNGLFRLAYNGLLEKIIPQGSRIKHNGFLNGGFIEVIESPYSKYTQGKLYTLDSVLDGNAFPQKTGNGEIKNTDKQQVINRLKSCEGSMYLFGGCYSKGVGVFREFLEKIGFVDMFEKHIKDNDIHLSNEERELVLNLKGLDCSGLLCQATDYLFMGDAKDVYRFGIDNKGYLLDIAGKNSKEICNMLEPLDVIVYKGHMIVVIDDNMVIQAVGLGENANAFASVTSSDPKRKYNRVVIDNAYDIIKAIMERLRKTPTSEWEYDDEDKFMIMRCFPD